ncbi:hypothetical protein FD823_05350, partial [Klebsiella pneumoniae]|nr:hypothetical protein [Klebsiella pneumoniae]
VLMWLMKTLLTSRCINQRGAGHRSCPRSGNHVNPASCLKSGQNWLHRMNPTSRTFTVKKINTNRP